uniref:Uncharacterized protein n=1 Tax=Arundo donax TaxID=35708 RepID=A0A0A8ZHH0_ARUDO
MNLSVAHLWCSDLIIFVMNIA